VPRRGRFLVRSIPGLSGHAGDGGPLLVGAHGSRRGCARTGGKRCAAFCASAGFWKWFDPETAPFLPVPEIATNPNGGTTIGILPVWLRR